jgi:phosphoribosylamine---glycine ligase
VGNASLTKILVVGSGGREHALVWRLAHSGRPVKLYCAPGNPGIEDLAELVPLKATDIEGLATFAARYEIDLSVIGPEQPLAEGVVDLFRERGLTVFGPTKAASELEWSKAFAKDFMVRHGIPSAAHRTFDANQIEDARACIAQCDLPVVLKADGLAAGKGVMVCETREAARDALDDILARKSFGAAGARLVIEDFLRGEEASLFAVTDGDDYVLLASAQDHKRVFDGDLGKNTGGMGAYAPAPVVTDDLLAAVEQQIIRPTLRGMAQEGRPYQGCLYVGLMIGSQGPKVVEFNARFGDPETQVVLPLFEGDFIGLLLAASTNTMRSWRQTCTTGPGRASAVCVVLASGGYPDQYENGFEIAGLDRVRDVKDAMVFHAGTRRDGNRILTAGGRVLGVTAVDRTGTLSDTIRRVYDAVGMVAFEKMHYRRDIGKKALLKRDEVNQH